jgi:ABC-2 type transport system permease protein
MILTIRSEWLKLRTVRVHIVLSIVAIAFPVIVAVLASSFGSDPENVRTSELAENITGTALISVMLLGAIAAISLTSEFAHGTIRPTYAATPNRVHVMVAKLFVNSVVAGILTSALVAVCWVLAAAIHNNRGADISLSIDDGSVGVLTGLVVLAVIITWFAFGIGLIVRNSSATVTFLLLWPLVIENILAGVFSLLNVDGLTKWLPYRAGFEAAMLATPGDDALGRPAGWLWFGVFSAALVGLGLVANVKRDA